MLLQRLSTSTPRLRSPSRLPAGMRQWADCLHCGLSTTQWTATAILSTCHTAVPTTTISTVPPTIPSAERARQPYLQPSRQLSTPSRTFVVATMHGIRSSSVSLAPRLSLSRAKTRLHGTLFLTLSATSSQRATRS